jgi:integrase
LVALIDKVLQHDAQTIGHQPPIAITEFLHHNASVKLAMQRNRKEDEPELVFLSDAEFQRLVAVLQRWPQAVAEPLGSAPNSANSRPESSAGRHATTPAHLSSNSNSNINSPLDGSAASPPRWQDCRDAASTALQLAAGLSPTDIRALDARAGLAACRSAGNGEAMIWIPGNGKLDERKAPISAWAMPLLHRWVDAFEANKLSSEWLFPGRANAVSAWSKPSQYDVAKTIMSTAGLGHMTSFHLRHTWALRQLAAGQSEQNVARWLGVRDDEVMHRYRDALPKL